MSQPEPTREGGEFRRRRWRGGPGDIAPGYWLIVIGVIFLLNNLGLIPGWNIVWPLLLIAFGVFLLIRRSWWEV